MPDSLEQSSVHEAAAGSNGGDRRLSTTEIASRIEAAKTAHKRSLETKVSDRESLLAEAKSLETQVQELEQLKAQYQVENESGELPEDAVAEFQNIERLIRELQDSAQQVNQRVDTLSAYPRVLEQLQSQAESEEVDRARRLFLADGWERTVGKDLRSMTDSVAQTVREYETYDTELQAMSRQDFENSKRIDQLYKEVRGAVSEKVRAQLPDTWYDLERSDIEDLYNKQGLPLLRGKDGAALKRLLEQWDDISSSERFHNEFMDKLQGKDEVRDRPSRELRAHAEIMGNFLKLRLDEFQVDPAAREQFLGRVQERVSQLVLAKLGIPESAKPGMEIKDFLREKYTPEQVRRYELLTKLNIQI